MFEKVILRWIFWSLALALALGGKPWKFPAGGKVWIDSTKQNKIKKQSDF
jgi:hypothetical protein